MVSCVIIIIARVDEVVMMVMVMLFQQLLLVMLFFPNYVVLVVMVNQVLSIVVPSDLFVMVGKSSIQRKAILCYKHTDEAPYQWLARSNALVGGRSVFQLWREDQSQLSTIFFNGTFPVIRIPRNNSDGNSTQINL